MVAFVNELSFVGQIIDRSQCASSIVELIKIINMIRPHLGDAPVYTSRDLLDKNISPGYTIQDFIYDKKTDKEIIRVFLIIVTKGPYCETLLEKVEHKYIITSNGVDVKGSCIAAACHKAGILTSLKGSISYDCNPIEVEYKEGTGEFQELPITNLLDTASAEIFIAEQTAKYTKDNISWDIFWNKRELLFPKLVFCKRLASKPSDIDFKIHYSRIRHHLQCMNNYMVKIRKGEIKTPNYADMGVDASTESDETLYHHGHDRTYDCPDGVKRLFSWHSKIKGANKRIHFYPPDDTTDDFYIGYIGKHLPTISDPH
ncbi:MAG: hypothetical protein HQK96_17530 [Nitrospirae bacterium]|nr:hypothetical protein [Nitrospirota bacterium]